MFTLLPGTMDNRCVYILHGERYYIGSTNDLGRRIKEHQSKGYSAKRIGKRSCLGYIPCDSKKDARSLELQIKKSGHPERYIVQDSFVTYELNH